MDDLQHFLRHTKVLYKETNKIIWKRPAPAALNRTLRARTGNENQVRAV